MRKLTKRSISLLLAGTMGVLLSGCAQDKEVGKKVEIEIVQYKPEAAKYFDELEEKFNATHDNIHLTISSPNDAMTILKTRFIREDYPDIIGIGGDVNFANFIDSDLLMNIEDYEGLENIRQSYLDIDKELEFVPQDGVYAVPYAANAAGILYNRKLFKEHGWEIPTTYSEFIQLCEEIQEEGILPLYFGYKDTWTCLAPWNAIACNLAPSDIAAQVNRGEATFSEAYKEVAIKVKELLKYGVENPAAYSYNDACTAFAKGESAMYAIGSYAIPQIKSVNPDMDIDSFVFPANEDESNNILNSGNDLQFSVMANCENKEAAYEVLNFLLEDENVQAYIDNQNAVPCKEGDFELSENLDGMKEYIEQDRMADFQDHHYPSEMSVDAMIQTYLLDNSENATETFLTRFDTEWKRYNRDLIRKVQEYQKENPNSEGGEH